MKTVKYRSKLIWVVAFGVAMAFAEAAIVVYLREILYPEGFSFPLKPIPTDLLIVEIGRELSTMVMLAVVAWLSGKFFWERFGWFILAFGVWDILYYVFLKILLDWPSSLLEWDVLFLIPIPWIGPVIAPVLVAVLMVSCGFMITWDYSLGRHFHATIVSLLTGLAATGIILFSFMRDLDASLRFALPRPYSYWLLAVGLAGYVVAFAVSLRKRR